MDWQTTRFRSPIFGECGLRRHEPDEIPSPPLGYVELEGEPTKLVIALWRGGKWRTRGGRPFRSAVIAWYSMVRPDGSPVLGRAAESPQPEGHS